MKSFAAGTLTLGFLVMLAGSALAEAAQTTPTEVLVGTDTRPLGSFRLKAAAGARAEAGVYQAETGGATIEAEVRVLGSRGLLRLTRRYAEPGDRALIRTYQLSAAGPGAYTGKGIDVRVLEAASTGAPAILLLEHHSGVDGIPASLWIHLSLVRPPKSGPGPRTGVTP